jgi:hypothetical protein
VDKPYFKVRTPLGVEVRTTVTYWGEIVTFKHPVMRGKEDRVKATLVRPLEIRRSRKDPTVHLYYGADPPYYTLMLQKNSSNGHG